MTDVALLTPWRAVVEYHYRVYRRTWRGSIFGRFLSPVFFLLSIGLGLGSLVDQGAGGILVAGTTVPYLLYVAPAIMATQSMMVGVSESTWPVMGAIVWNRVYHGMLATPVGVRDIALGHVVFLTGQVAVATVIFAAVGAALGAFGSWGVVGAVAVCVLVGLAFTTLTTAFAVRQENDAGFSVLFRLVVTPLMLFSGTFYPVSALPAVLQPVAWLTPLWHGVEASRLLALGMGEWPAVAGHVLALVGFAALGWWLTVRGLRARLVV